MIMLAKADFYVSCTEADQCPILCRFQSGDVALRCHLYVAGVLANRVHQSVSFVRGECRQAAEAVTNTRHFSADAEDYVDHPGQGSAFYYAGNADQGAKVYC